MAKKSYKIPTTLDVSYMDMNFNLKSKNGVGLQKPVSAKIVVMTLVATFLWFYLVFNSFIKAAGLPIIIGFSLTWAVFSFIMVKEDATGRTGIELVFTMFNYALKSGREMPTRMSDPVGPFRGLFGIDSIDQEDGLIHYTDDDIGHVYHVVGSASSLMFEADKRAILRKVDGFYRKLPVGVEVIYDTIYEGHSVEEQIESCKDDMRNLQSESKGLQALLDERYDILKYAINNNQGLTSLHQYLIVRAKNVDDLREFENLLIGDVENDGLMFRLAKTLTYPEMETYFKSILQGVPKRVHTKKDKDKQARQAS